MAIDPISAGIEAGSNLITGLTNTFVGINQARLNRNLTRSENDKNRELQRELLEKEQAFSQSMFDQTNEYNSPAAMRARLEEAGLSASLAYGGNAVGSSAASPVAGGTQQGGSSQGVPAAIAGQLTPLNIAQAQALTSQANLNNSKADAISGYEKDLSEARANLFGSMKELNESNINLNDAKKGNIDKDTALKEAQTAILDFEQKVNDLKGDALTKEYSITLPNGSTLTTNGAALPIIEGYAKTLATFKDVGVKQETINNLKQHTATLIAQLPVAQLEGFKAQLEKAFAESHTKDYETFFGKELGALIQDAAARAGDWGSMSNMSRADYVIKHILSGTSTAGEIYRDIRAGKVQSPIYPNRKPTGLGYPQSPDNNQSVSKRLYKPFKHPIHF